MAASADVAVAPAVAEEAEPSVQQPEVFGVVAISEKTPATPDTFAFWSRDDETVPLEPGRIVTAQHPTDSAVRAIGIVENLYATRDIPSPLDSYYAHGYGNPQQEMATHQDLVRVASVEVVRRTDGRNQPVSGSWPVRFAVADEITQAYGAEVKPDKALLAGFALDAYYQPVPINLDARFVLGYEGAHVNVSGASGLATKTSYALFLIYSILAYSKKDPSQKVAAIAFNVKESDLLRIDNLPGSGKGEAKDWQECMGLIRKKFTAQEDERLQTSLWQVARKEGIDPFSFVKDKKLRFLAAASKGDTKKPQATKPGGTKLETFYFGLADLTRAGDQLSLEVLFDPDDLDDKLTAVLYNAADELQGKQKSFDQFLSEMWKKVNDKKGAQITIGGTTQHPATVIRFLRRLQHTVKHQLPGVVTMKDPEGRPIPVEDLEEGQLWVIDISRLHDKGQRLVFLSIMDRLAKLLEAKRNKEAKIRLYEEGEEIDLDNFPDKVVVFVDELNKFSPAKAQRAPLRSRIVDITARGRSYGLSLIGAQQLASQIEEQVLVNTSTFLVGRSHALEIGGRTYEWLREGLRQKAQTLQKGQMFLWHAVHARPALIHFPVPLHQLLEE
jgi:DNA helicase HerA-like ATPase